jgi:hypothetical protein
LPIIRHVELERGGKLLRVLRSGGMVLLDCIDGMRGANREQGEQRLLLLALQPRP